MSKAYRCDHCLEYFDKLAGGFRFDSEVCDAKYGYVRYRVVALVFSEMGASAPLGEQSDKELCPSCIQEIVAAAVNKEKL